MVEFLCPCCDSATRRQIGACCIYMISVSMRNQTVLVLRSTCYDFLSQLTVCSELYIDLLYWDGHNATAMHQTLLTTYTYTFILSLGEVKIDSVFIFIF